MVKELHWAQVAKKLASKERTCISKAYMNYKMQWGHRRKLTSKMMSFPLKIAMKCRGSLPMVTLTWTGAPLYLLSTLTAWYAHAVISSWVAWRPCHITLFTWPSTPSGLHKCCNKVQPSGMVHDWAWKVDATSPSVDMIKCWTLD